MSARNRSTSAVILRGREGPSGARIVTFLSPDDGLVDAFVFGGGKSKLRSLAAPWHAGNAWTYTDPVRDFIKLSDFDARESFPGLREDLRRIWAASFVAEGALRTEGGGGERERMFALVIDALRALDAARDERIDYVAVQYAWRLSELMGTRPETGACVRCGRAFKEGEARRLAGASEGFLCPACAASAQAEDALARAPSLSSGAARYLEQSSAQGFAESLRSGVEASALPPLRRVVFELARAACEGPLKTLESGIGIL